MTNMSCCQIKLLWWVCDAQITIPKQVNQNRRLQYISCALRDTNTIQQYMDPCQNTSHTIQDKERMHILKAESNSIVKEALAAMRKLSCLTKLHKLQSYRRDTDAMPYTMHFHKISWKSAIGPQWWMTKTERILPTRYVEIAISQNYIST